MFYFQVYMFIKLTLELISFFIVKTLMAIFKLLKCDGSSGLSSSSTVGFSIYIDDE